MAGRGSLSFVGARFGCGMPAASTSRLMSRPRGAWRFAGRGAGSLRTAGRQAQVAPGSRIWQRPPGHFRRPVARKRCRRCCRRMSLIGAPDCASPGYRANHRGFADYRRRVECRLAAARDGQLRGCLPAATLSRRAEHNLVNSGGSAGERHHVVARHVRSLPAERAGESLSITARCKAVRYRANIVPVMKRAVMASRLPMLGETDALRGGAGESSQGFGTRLECHRNGEITDPIGFCRRKFACANVYLD